MDELDQILKLRKAPEMRSNLAERIIDESLKPAGKSQEIWAQIQAAFGQAFLLPQPLLTCSVVLLFGLWAGMQVNIDSAEDLSASEELAAYLDVEDSLIGGGLL